MDYKELKAHRTVLLDLYKSLGKALKKEGNEIPKSIKQSQGNIVEEKFLLAIVGEGKAGKSTFINALLKEEILPFAALQATSEIIEIVKSDKQEVRVTFANGIEQVIEDDIETPENEAGTFLKQIASVNEEYRDIPIVQVNRFLIDHYKGKKKKAVFTKKELEELISFSELENVHKLDEETFKEKICKYIDKNISCDEIPKSITLGYPHDLFDFRHFRIVDTPGINAKGGLENQTKDFINQADAVIYLHKAPPIESKSLANALENELPEKVKEHLILVLTHKYNSTDEESEELLAGIKKLYPEIGSDNIFFVDSLTELHSRELEKKEMNEIKTILTKDKEIGKLISASFLNADNDKHRFLNLLEEQANFTEIRQRIKRDAQNSASNQMKDFASAIQEQYEVLDTRISARIALLGDKRRDPQSFASDIQKQKNEMEIMSKDYNEFMRELREDFSPQYKDSKYYKKINRMVNSFIDEINKKEFDPDEHDKKTVLSYVMKLVEDFENEMTKCIDLLKENFQKRIADKDKEAQSDYSIAIPKIALQDIFDRALKATEEAINKKLDAEGEVGDVVGGTLTGLLPAIRLFITNPITTVVGLGGAAVGVAILVKKHFNRKKIKKTGLQKFWQEVQVDLVPYYTDYETQLQIQIDTMINKFCDGYKHEFAEDLSERQRVMKDLEAKRKTNEELSDEISTLETEKKRIEGNIKECEKIKGEL